MLKNGPPRWLTIGAGLSVVLAVLMIAGARGLRMSRHYLDVGGGIRVSFEDSGLSVFTPSESGPYRGRELYGGLLGDARAFGIDWPVYFHRIRWATGSEQWMLTIDLPILLLFVCILPLVWCGWHARHAWHNPSQSRFRFSIRAVLLAFLAMGVLLLLRQYSRAQSRLAENLETRGARLDWNCTDTPQSSVVWLLFGDNFYDDLFGVFFENDSISAADIDSLHKYPQLIRLKFTDCTISDEAIERIASLPQLRELTFASCKASSKSIESCARAPHVGRLSLIDIDVAPIDLTKFASVGQLEIRTPTLHDSKLAQLASIHDLGSLTLESSQLTDDGLQQLSQLKSLDSLTIHNSPIAGTGLQALADRGSVLFLDLEGCQVNSAGCEVIGKMPKLRVVSLRGTNVAMDDVLALSAHCEVVFP